MSEWKETDFGLIPKEWELGTFGQICELLTDGAHNSPKHQLSVHYMASVKDMRYNHFDYSECKTISESDFDFLVRNNCSPKVGDIILSKDGANCLDLIFVYKQPQKIVVLSSIAIARLKKNNSPDFYRYFLLSPNMQFLMRNNFVSGSAIPRVVLKDFRNIPVPLLSYEEQSNIASILCGLDDKIDLLHRQNETLESMAEILFRQWFIEEAKDDWEEISLFNSVVLVGGGTPKTTNEEYWEGGIKWLSGGDIANNHKSIVVSTEKSISEQGLTNSSAVLLPKFSTVISARGTVGKYCIIAESMAFSQSNYGIKPKIENTYFFTYLLISSAVEELKSAAYGSIFDTITTNTFREHIVYLPESQRIIDFENMVKPYFNKILNNVLQIRTLENLRDILLPKLMSGEVRLEIN